MQCLNPIHLDVRGTEFGIKAKKPFILAPCGRCPACLIRRQNEWAFRILMETQNAESSYFITLTYDDAHLEFTEEGVATLNKDTLRLFFRYLRRKFDKEEVRMFACGEYGDQFDRPHYHAILFFKHSINEDKLDYIISKLWTKGFFSIFPFNSVAMAKYVAKYSVKQFGIDYDNKQPPFALMSKGIGKNFMNQENQDLVRINKDFVVHDSQGNPYSLPRYYKDFFFSKDEQLEHFLKTENDADLIDMVKSFIICQNSDSKERLDETFPNKQFYEQKLRQMNSYEQQFIQKLKKNGKVSETIRIKNSFREKELKRQQQILEQSQFRESITDFNNFNNFNNEK